MGEVYVASARRPREAAAPKHVQVDVEDLLARVGAGVEDEPVAPLEAVGLHDGTSRREHIGQLHRRDLGELDGVGDMPLRDDQDVRGRLWVDVAEGQAELGLDDNHRLDLPGDEATEEAVRRIAHAPHASEDPATPPAARRDNRIACSRVSPYVTMAGMAPQTPDLQESADRGLERLYTLHWDSMVRLAWLLLHDGPLAEDVVQDALINVHRHWASLESEANATAYLRRSVVNGARSALRHRGVAERYVRSEAADPRSSRTHPGADEPALARVTTNTLAAAVAELPTRQREVLALRYFLDLSEADIADALGISPGAVKSHAHRGLATLRDRSDGLR